MGSYTNTFTGNQTQPALFSLNTMTVSANATLAWPTEAATAGPYVASINVYTTQTAVAVAMPPANQGGDGNTSDWYNAGSNTFSVTDNSGNSLLSVASGQSWRLVLLTNTSVNGPWLGYQLGSGTSSATAAALAGAGLSALGGTKLNINETIVTKSANYSILTTDRAILIVWTGGSGIFSLPAAATALGGFKVGVRNGGTGTLTVQTAGSDTINGAASLAMAPTDSAYIDTDGVSAWYTVGLGKSAIFLFTYLAIDLTGISGNYPLSGAQLNQSIYKFTGVPAGNITVQVPPNIAEYIVNNQTTGSNTITFSTTTGSGVTLNAGQSTFVYCDGTNINFADQFGFNLPVPVSAGGTGATTASGARTNLGTTDEAVALALILG